MEKYLGECNLNTYFIYLDDIIVFPKHLKNMLKDCKAQSKKKSHFFHDKVKYVEHVVSKQLNQTRSRQYWDSHDFPCSTNPDEVRQFNWTPSTFYQRLYEDRKTITPADATHFREEPKKSKAMQSLEWEKRTRESISITSNFKEPFVLHTEASL